MQEIELKISDETLRDGQQQPHITFRREEMIDIARAIYSLGSAIHHIDIMPAMHSIHEDVATQLVAEGIPIILATIMKKKAIQYSIQITPTIITISSLSDELMAAKGITRERNTESTVRELGRAKENKVAGKSVYIGLAGEDSARADSGFLVEYIHACEHLMDFFIYCDTDGQATPKQVSRQITDLKRKTNVPIYLHCHNDSGLAVENTIAGILAGADGISTTFTGIGDRAGNAATEKVLYYLREEYGIFVKNVDYDKLPEVAELIKEYAGAGPAEPDSEMSRTHEAGIHVDALLKAREQGLSVYATNPYEQPKIVFGISSGLATLEYILGQFFMPVGSAEEAKLMMEWLKKVSLSQKRSLYPLEVYKEVVDFNIDFLSTRNNCNELRLL